MARRKKYNPEDDVELQAIIQEYHGLKKWWDENKQTFEKKRRGERDTRRR